MKMGELEELALRARAAAVGLSTLKTEVKNGALLAMGDALQSAAGSILDENAKDLETG